MQIAELESQSRGAARTELDLAGLVSELVELYEPLAIDRGLTLTANIGVAARITGHRQLLAQALSNLLDNAVKYTPAGGTIHVTLSEEENAYQLVVADSGPGIPAEDRERVLRPFIQLARDRGQEGSGLGSQPRVRSGATARCAPRTRRQLAGPERQLAVSKTPLSAGPSASATRYSARDI